MFQEFCLSIASGEHLNEPGPESSALYAEHDVDLKQRADALVEIMKNKMGILDRVPIPFIEEAFIDHDRVEMLLKNFRNGDVPDYLLIVFSQRLYGREFADLTVEQQAIIKTLAMYICISIQGGN